MESDILFIKKWFPFVLFSFVQCDLCENEYNGYIAKNSNCFFGIIYYHYHGIGKIPNVIKIT